MRGRTGWMAIGAVAVFGLVVVAGEKPPEEYVKNMKATNAAAQSLRKNLETKDYDAIAKDAATLKTLFATTEEFWTKRNAEDAVSAAKAGAKAAEDLETAAKAKNEAGVTDASKAVNGTCKTCHDAHRERLPDGTSEIK
jgi:cytochrome c556